MPLRINNNILNQKGTPAFFSDTFANRPAFGFAGRVFISTDTGQIFEDTGTAWTLLADAGVGGGTLASVTANGNTTATGIVITANGLSSNSLTDTSKTVGSVLFSGTAGLISQDNANLFWDDTNNRLGISTTAPGAKLDIHGAGILVQLNGTGTNNSYLQYLNAGATKWQIGNNYNAGANSFDLYNNVLSNVALSVNAAYNVLQLNGNLAIKQSTGIFTIAGYNAIACDSGGFFFNCSTANTAYFNLINLTGSRTYTFPDTNGTLALTSQIPSISGTTNYITKFTSASALGISGIYEGTTNFISIGNTNTTYNLDVSGTGRFTGGLNWGNTNGSYMYTVGNTQIFASSFNGSNVLYSGSSNFSINNAADSVILVRLFDGGNFAIGSSTDNGYKLQLNGQPGANGYTLWTNYSDIRLKENIEDINADNILDKLNKLRPVTFNYNALSNYDIETRNRKISGFIAQELKQIFPEMVGTVILNDIEYLDTNTSNLQLYLLKAIQELSKKLERNNIN
jgi:hypothetical protein